MPYLLICQYNHGKFFSQQELSGRLVGQGPKISWEETTLLGPVVSQLTCQCESVLNGMSDSAAFLRVTYDSDIHAGILQCLGQ
jgi:hypothetical protein